MKSLKPFISLEEENSEKDKSRLERAKAADLITLPKDVEGTNCGNCQYVRLEDQYCTHPEVDQKVSPKMCCAFWDNPGAKREWLKMNSKK